MNTATIRPRLIIVPLLSSVLLGGCVWQSDYDALKAQNEQLQQQVTAQQAQIAASATHVERLQGAIAYTVNSDLLFAPGSYHMSDAGKKLIAQYAAKLAPTQTAHILVKGYTDNQPIGAALQKEGITSNQILSQKRAEDVKAYMVSQGANPDLIDTQGFGDTDPVASNATARGRAKNRRVVLTLAGQ